MKTDSTQKYSKEFSVSHISGFPGPEEHSCLLCNNWQTYKLFWRNGVYFIFIKKYIIEPQNCFYCPEKQWQCSSYALFPEASTWSWLAEEKQRHLLKLRRVKVNKAKLVVKVRILGSYLKVDWSVLTGTKAVERKRSKGDAQKRFQGLALWTT